MGIFRLLAQGAAVVGGFKVASLVKELRDEVRETDDLTSALLEDDEDELEDELEDDEDELEDELEDDEDD